MNDKCYVVLHICGDFPWKWDQPGRWRNYNYASGGIFHIDSDEFGVASVLAEIDSRVYLEKFVVTSFELGSRWKCNPVSPEYLKKEETRLKEALKEATKQKAVPEDFNPYRGIDGIFHFQAKSDDFRIWARYADNGDTVIALEKSEERCFYSLDELRNLWAQTAEIRWNILRHFRTVKQEQ